MEGRVGRKWALFKESKISEVERTFERRPAPSFYFRSFKKKLFNSDFTWFNLISRGDLSPKRERAHPTESESVRGKAQTCPVPFQEQRKDKGNNFKLLL